jgi:hypothetical protein
MKRFAGPKDEVVAFNETRRVVEMLTVDRDDLDARAKNAVEQADSQRATLDAHLTRSHLDRKSGRDFSDAPLAHQVRRQLMLSKPQLNRFGLSLICDCSHNDGGIEIVSQ